MDRAGSPKKWVERDIAQDFFTLRTSMVDCDGARGGYFFEGRGGRVLEN